jgi:hypothetical protein
MMKSQFISTLFFVILTFPSALVSSAQQVALANDGEEYWISLGTNKVNAVSNGGYGEEGYKLDGDRLRIMGFFRKSLNQNFARATKLEVNKVAIVIKHRGAALDSQVVSCSGIHSKWRDFYVNLKDVRPGNDYMVYAYDAETNNLLSIRNFIIAADKVPEFVPANKPFYVAQVYTYTPSTTSQKLCDRCEGSGKISWRQNKTWDVVKSTNTDGSKNIDTYSGYVWDESTCPRCLGTGKGKN